MLKTQVNLINNTDNVKIGYEVSKKKKIKGETGYLES